MEYLKLNITLLKCASNTTVFDEVSSEDITYNTDETTEARDPLIKNVLGENLFSSLQSLFQLDQELESVEDLPQVRTRFEGTPEKQECDYIVSTHEFSFTLFTLLMVCLSLTTACICILSVKFLWKQWKRGIVICQGSKPKQSIPRIRPLVTLKPVTDGNTPTNPTVESSGKNVVNVNLHYSVCKTCPGKRSDTDLLKFLEDTTSKLFSKLDRLLLKGATSTDQTQSTFATPRLARRSLVRRQRVGSSPMLTSGASTDDQDHNTEEKSKTWSQFKQFAQSMGWNTLRKFEVDESSLNRSSQKLLQYYHRMTTLSMDNLQATALVVNYTLYLIKTELENMNGHNTNVCRFLNFIPIGSNKYGTKVSRVNACEFFMVLQLPFPVKGAIHELSDERNQIPAGMFAMYIDNQQTETGSEKKMLVSCDIGNEKLQCVSSVQFFKTAEDLIDSCLFNLHARLRSAMDKLPFTVKRAQTSLLQLILDSKAIVGLGEPEVKVSLIPVVAIVTEGMYQSPVLFATPRMDEGEPKWPAGTSSNVINPNTLWSLRYNDYEETFLNGLDRKFKESGIEPCHSVCLIILKALLTACDRRNLLDRGMLPSYHIETVMKFLLLESEPEQWTFDQLADRFSDIIHFLEEAYTNGRLPAFFMNNQHLNKKMGQVGTNPLLTRKRQQNLLAESSRERLEKCLSYMKERIREVGLVDCVREEYSPDMWEYEFFLFN